MNLLERRAVRRAERLLAPLMEPGEQVIEFDMDRSDADPRVEVHFATTDAALYIVAMPLGNTSRVTWSMIASVFWQPDNPLLANKFRLTFVTGDKYFVTMKRGKRALAGFVKQKVEDRIVHSEHIPLAADGKGVSIQLRPLGPAGNMGWWVTWDADVDANDPELEGKLREVVRARSAEFGIGEEKSGGSPSVE